MSMTPKPKELLAHQPPTTDSLLAAAQSEVTRLCNRNCKLIKKMATHASTFLLTPLLPQNCVQPGKKKGELLPDRADDDASR